MSSDVARKALTSSFVTADTASHLVQPQPKQETSRNLYARKLLLIELTEEKQSDLKSSYQ